MARKSVHVIQRDEEGVEVRVLMRPPLIMRRDDVIRVNVETARVLPDSMPVEGGALKTVIRCDGEPMPRRLQPRRYLRSLTAIP